MYIYTFSKIQTPQDLKYSCNKITKTWIHEYRPGIFLEMMNRCSFLYSTLSI